jgi:ABC-2 type transport system ATP-binding protein
VSEPVLRCQGLRKRFGDIQAVNGVSFEIALGESYGLLGPNGAGKTTTISIVAGLLEADAGEAFVAGERLTTRSVAAKAAIGFVPQELAIYPDLTAHENLSFFARLYGLSAKQARARTEEVLEVIGLSERADDQAKTYSGGMKRRLNIGIGLLHEPKLLILDEPTVGVDPQSRNAILESVEQLGERGMAVLYTTHYMEEAERLCSRIGIIDQGKILGLGTLEELLTRLPFEDEITFPLTAETAPLVKRLAAEGEVTAVNGTQRFRPRTGYPLSAFFALTESLGLSPRLFVSQRPTLEAVFLHLTGRNLRDA